MAVSGAVFMGSSIQTEHVRNVPTETLTGDLLVAFYVDHVGSSLTLTEGTGNWTDLGGINLTTFMKSECWTAIATQDGNHVDNQPTFSGHTNGSYVTILSIPGASQTLDVVLAAGHMGVTAGYPTTNNSTFEMPGVTTITDGALVVGACTQDDDYSPEVNAWPAGWTIESEDSATNGTDGYITTGSVLMETAGATADPLIGTGGDNLDRREMLTIAVKPA